MTDWTKCSTVHIAREIAEQERRLRQQELHLAAERAFLAHLQSILAARAELHHAVAEAEVPA